MVIFDLRKCRLMAGVTQQELAMRLGITQSAVSQLEHKRENITLSTINLIATALEVNPKDLLKYNNSVVKLAPNTEDTFGYRLKRICQLNNITIKEVADATGIPKTTLYNITKRNTKKPRNRLTDIVIFYLKNRVSLTEIEYLRGSIL